jgi:uncharacterized damage-inducible protein DinB
MKSRDLVTLFEYNQWANERILRHAARVSPGQLTTPGTLSHDSLLKTLIHLADVDWSWRLACQTGAQPADYITEAQCPDIPALRKFWRGEMAEMLIYVRSLSDEQANGKVRYTIPRGTKLRTKTLWHVLVHVVNHGTHHRGEIGRYIAECGHSPGDLDFLNYVSKLKGH